MGQDTAFRTDRAPVRAAIFDLDGTLLDSLGVWERIDRDFLGRRGLDLPADYARAIVTMHLHEAAEYTIRRFSLNERPDDVVEEWTHMARDAYAATVPLKEGAAALLTRLRQSGVRLAVATALARELAEAALRRHGVYDWFDALAFTTDVGQGKSSPAVFLRAAQMLCVPPAACVVFEDTLAGIRSAKAAGMTAVGVYDTGAEAERAAIQATADRYIRRFDEISTVFW